MDIKNKRIVPLAFLSFAGAYLLTFLTAYVATLIENDVFGAVIEYAGYYMLSAISFIAPVILSAIILVVYAYGTTSSLVASALLITAASAFYVFPTTYLEYVYTYGSIEAIIFAFSSSIGSIFRMLISVFASVWIATFVLGKALKKTHNEVREYLPELLKERSDTDFLSPANLPILVFVLIRFLIELIGEIVYTVAFFITYGSDYSGMEIITMLFNYVLLFALIIISYLLTCHVKNSICVFSATDETSEESSDKGDAVDSKT